MKNLIKNSLFTLIFSYSFISCTSSFQTINNEYGATSKNPKTEKVTRNYTKGLRSDNPGVVESSIFNALIIRSVQPEAFNTHLTNEILRLEAAGQTSTIRYKSMLARYVLDNQELLEEVPPQRFESGSEYFNQLTRHLGQKLLGELAVVTQ